jgi:hypothetical protein
MVPVGLAAAFAVASIGGACGGDPLAAEQAATGGTAVEAAAGGGDLPQGSEPAELDPASFTVEIDNRYWPMAPGTQWTYVETDEEGSDLEVVVTVTAETRTIANGVEARVVRDTVRLEGEIVEDTFDWYAEDSAGNIWYLGEDTAEFEDGEIRTREGSFEAGVDGALAGVVMPADPRPGTTSRQEHYAGHAEDNGEILRVGEIVETPLGQYEGAVVTRDTIANEPDVLEYKFYVPDLGPVLALGISGGAGREELVSVEEVDPAGFGSPLGEPPA